MDTGTEIKKRAISLVEQLSQEMLEEAVQLLEALSLKSDRPKPKYSPNSEENDLLRIVQRQLPQEEQVRINYLRQKNENGEITDAEHRELLKSIEKVEYQDAERAAALIKLAEIRNVDLATVIEEFTPKEKSEYSLKKSQSRSPIFGRYLAHRKRMGDRC
jgi:hypothetical protein